MVINRRAVALFLVLALTGSALALQQQQLYREDCTEASAIVSHGERGEMEHCARGVVAVQQHSVFVEMILEEKDHDNKTVQFAAVVGLVKKCREVRNVFDNAVLWFNDQFLFGNKTNKSVKNATPQDAMGVNPIRNHTMEDLNQSNRVNGSASYDHENNTYTREEDGTGPDEGGNPNNASAGFITRKDMTERWGGCFIPNGFLHAVPGGQNITAAKQAISDDHAPRSTCEERYDQQSGGGGGVQINDFGLGTPLNGESVSSDLPPEHRDTVCEPTGDIGRSDPGSKCSQEESFFVTDPNGHRWVIDKSNCGFTLYTVHLQVDPWNPDRQGFADEAIWAYEDGQQRLGMPYAQNESDPMYDPCKNNAEVFSDRLNPEYDKLARYNESGAERTSPNDASGDEWAHYRRGHVGTTLQCAIEYNFLLAIELGDGTGGGTEFHCESTPHPDDDDGEEAAWEGNSHPHNPKEAECGPAHSHDAKEFNLFFDRRAPKWIEDNPYWDQADDPNGRTHGTPPVVTEDCSTTLHLPPDDYRTRAIEMRDFAICDTASYSGFHLHDGSQTIRPLND